MRWPTSCRAGRQQDGQDRFLNLQPVLGLIEHDALRVVDDDGGLLDAALSGEAVHEQERYSTSGSERFVRWTPNVGRVLG